MSTCLNRTLRACLAGLALFLVSSSIQAHAQARTLPTNTRFYVPPPAAGAEPQAISLLLQGQWKNALLIAGMELTPQAVWLTSGTPADVGAQVQTIVQGAAGQGAVPVMVLYNIPGRDCGSYSAGGAENTAAYQAWIDAIAQQLGNSKAVLIVEPDAIANLPSDCGYPTTVDATQLTADRYTQINYAVQTFGAHAPNALVYLDGGNSNWQAVGIIASRLMTAGLAKAQGFFTNVSNFRESTYEAKFDTWVSECVAFANNPADGGWRLGNYSYCASQYYSPNGPVNPNDISTWTYTDQWYAANLGSAVPSTHFVFDTSRNGQGPTQDSRVRERPLQSASVRDHNHHRRHLVQPTGCRPRLSPYCQHRLPAARCDSLGQDSRAVRWHLRRARRRTRLELLRLHPGWLAFHRCRSGHFRPALGLERSQRRCMVPAAGVATGPAS